MQALVCREFANPEALSLENIAEPQIGPDEVCIRVVACGINFPDLLILENKYQFKPDLPFSPGGEISGIVEAIGENINRFKIGDAVFSLCKWGGLSEKITLKEEQIHTIPAGISFRDAASLFYNFGTAYHALFDRGQLTLGQSLLVLGASGGVGLAALQLAKAKGAKVFAAASHEEKLEICKKYGADACINYEVEPLKERIKELTEGKGLDVVFDPVGGKYTEQALRSMAFAGRYLTVGFANGEIPKIPLNIPLLKSCAILGVFYGRFSREFPEKAQTNFEAIAQWRIQNKIKPHIQSTYSMQEALQALQSLKAREVIGKALVHIAPEIDPDAIPIPAAATQVLKIETTAQAKSLIGTYLGESSWFKIDQEQINSFALSTRDEQWIHLDQERTRNSKFGTPIAHGFLTLSLMPYLLNQIYAVTFSTIGVNYGLDKVRFLRPVSTGSEIRLRAKLKHALETKGAGLKLIIEAEIEIKGSDKVACYAELISVFYAENR
ncbi:zinc-binding dehydrogenase [Marinilongibacter aquaticus]|uniref:zinc-binding dehydrogenase n=1 Tax=Marinilongibacter aquaticus TaxID=2975157 RepID=UPI0021BDA714|nr:zinc-binding dehydrogenase [Marinilongibacter aquaticus]UBM57541.1 zinc-binding dehydrogenase [Marinilongibacter aquaticus]